MNDLHSHYQDLLIKTSIFRGHPPHDGAGYLGIIHIYTIYRYIYIHTYIYTTYIIHIYIYNIQYTYYTIIILYHIILHYIYTI